MHKRIVLKLSGEVLAGDFENNSSNKSFDDTVIDRITAEISQVLKSGTQVSVVIGGGNFWRGRDSKQSMDRTKADQIGMLATIMNGIYLADYFKLKGIGAKVFTPFIVGTMTEQFSKERVLHIMGKGKVAIFSGGTGHPFFSTDTIAALRAAELDCDAILFAKNIDGIYNCDPAKNSDAKKYNVISYDRIIKDNLNAIDIAAINICQQVKINSVAFDLRVPSSIVSANNSDSEEFYKIGTKITI